MTQTIERVRVHAGPSSVQDKPPSPRRSGRKLLGWAALAVGLVVALVVVLLSITSDPAPQRVETEGTPTESSLVGVPRSADAAERYLADLDTAWPAGVPGSADAAERYLADLDATRPAGVPGSADAAERYLADQK